MLSNFCHDLRLDLILISSTNIAPLLGSNNPIIKDINVVYPDPLDPCIPSKEFFS